MLGGLGNNSARNARKIIPNLWVWGVNSNGQLGIRDVMNRVSPVRVDSSSTWSFISAGRLMAASRKTDGTLWSWGTQNEGELGLGDTSINRSSPVQIGTDTNWSIVSVGGTNTANTQFKAHVMAIKTDGTLWGWGANTNNTAQAFVSAAIGAGRLGTENTTSSSSPIQIATGSTWSAVSAGGVFTAAVKTDGTLWTWGQNTGGTSHPTGNLGLGDVISRSSPVQVGTGVNWSKVFCGALHMHSIKTDGTLWSWGANTAGQLGLSNAVSVSSPVQVGTDTNWSYITTTRVIGSSIVPSASTLAIKTNGTLWAWGLNTSGQLGLSDVTSRSSPVQVGTGTDWNYVICLNTATLATKKDGTRWAWGLNTSGLPWGSNYNTTSESAPMQLITTLWTAISARYTHVLGIQSNGSLWGWGSNNVGQLGLGDAIARSSTTQVGSDTNWSTVAVGESHSIAVKSAGSIWSWGVNSFGNLGLGDTATRSSPVQIGLLNNWTSKITAAQTYTLAIKNDNTLWAWGYSFFGMLGKGDTISYSSPVQVGTDSWDQITTGNYHSIGIRSNAIYGWGLNDNGQLGVGNASSRSSPVQIGALTNWSIASGGWWSSTMAIKTDGTLWGWGRNGSGELGLGNTVSRSSPVQVGTDTDWSKIKCGVFCAFAIKTNGTLWAWGANSSGQLGTGNTVNVSSPVQVGTDTIWSDIASGNSYTLGLKTDNTIWFWGFKTGGYSGDGIPLTSSSSPIQIGTLANWDTPFGTNTMGGTLKRRQNSLGF
jgi:alpha-tubulin suppressor-like RCC1 family protein